MISSIITATRATRTPMAAARTVVMFSLSVAVGDLVCYMVFDLICFVCDGYDSLFVMVVSFS